MSAHKFRLILEIELDDEGRRLPPDTLVVGREAVSRVMGGPFPGGGHPVVRVGCLSATNLTIADLVERYRRGEPG